MVKIRFLSLFSSIPPFTAFLSPYRSFSSILSLPTSPAPSPISRSLTSPSMNSTESCRTVAEEVRRGRVGSEAGKRKSGSSYGGEKRVYANNGGGGDSDGTNATDRSKLVFLDPRKQFELEDLLRASAEILGKGSLGTVYRAVLDDGCTMAVKRLKDTGETKWRREREIRRRKRDGERR